jgi:hypothetical protein
LSAYRWSSYRGYAGLARQDEFVTEELVLREFGTRRDKSKLRCRRFVEEGLVREIENPFEAARWQAALGDESFARRLKHRLNTHRGKTGEMTAVRRAHRCDSSPILPSCLDLTPIFPAGCIKLKRAFTSWRFPPLCLQRPIMAA